MLESDKEEEAFEKYPRNYLQYGEKLKTLIKQKKPVQKKHHPHIWVYGFPGTGKTAVMNFLYPQTYKKDLNNRFFDLYDDKIHSHVMLEDLDHANVDKLGIQFLKTLCDESGFPIDQKYKTPQLTKTTVLVTSNFTIGDVVPEGKGVDETKMALHRRFLQVRIDDLLRFLGLKLIPSYERKQLKLNGNNDPAAVFMTWDYVMNYPTGEEVKDPTYYQNMILERYYS
nr:nonstructural protein [Flumine parvovirus 18]